MKAHRAVVRLVGWTVVGLPFAGLAYLVHGLSRPSAVTVARIERSVDAHLASWRGRAFPSVFETHRNAQPPCTAFDEAGWRQRRPGQPTIDLFDESSLVLSDGKRTDQILRERLGPRFPGLSVSNFALCGVDSFAIRAWVEEVLQSPPPPSLIVIYAGHNDYTNAHVNAVSPLYDMFPSVIALGFELWASPADNFEWHRLSTTARLVKWAQMLRLATLPEDVGGAHGAILSAFQGNLDAIITACQARGVPVVLVTPVANLHKEPFGSRVAVTEVYRTARREPDPRKRLTLLRKARDASFLTPSTAAKTPLIEHLRSLRRTGVYVLDFEALLEAEGFDFGDDGFSDYFHMRESLHVRLARAIDELIAATPALTARLASP
jgi:lysophospholipase L1-like esterase